MARPLTGSQRRNLIRGWGRQAIAAGIPLLTLLRNLHDLVAGGAETGEQRPIISTSNAGQSVSFSMSDSMDAVSQANAALILSEVLDVAESLAPSFPSDDAGLLYRLVQYLGTPIRSFRNDYSAMRLGGTGAPLASAPPAPPPPPTPVGNTIPMTDQHGTAISIVLTTTDGVPALTFQIP